MISWSTISGECARSGTAAGPMDGWRAAVEGALAVTQETAGVGSVRLTVGKETARLFPAADAAGVLDIPATRAAAQALVDLIESERAGVSTARGQAQGGVANG